MQRPLLPLSAGLLLSLAIIIAPARAQAGRPDYVIAFVPLQWSGSRAAFESEAQRQATLFVQESGIAAYANVEIQLVEENMENASLTDPWLVNEVVAFGAARVPADRYIGVTDGDLAPGGDSWVAGWTWGLDAAGAVVEAGSISIAAHELGHTFGLCDEYSYGAWAAQNAERPCPNPYPPQCPQLDRGGAYCEGLPAPDGRNSIMGPSGLTGPYAYNAPSAEYLAEVFTALFGVPTDPSPKPQPTPAPPDVPIVAVSLPDLSLVLADPVAHTLAPAPALYPVWSPDGSRIAFTCAPQGNLDLCLIAADGSEYRQITSTPARETHPLWLDSRRLLYVSDSSGELQLSRLDLEAGIVLILPGLPFPADWPAVSPDRSELVFSAAPDGNWDLYRVSLDPDGLPLPGTLQRLTDSRGLDISPALSADGDRLAFASDRSGSLDLYLLSASDTSPRRLTSSPGGEWDAVWLPDGRLLYQQSSSEQVSLWLLDPSQESPSAQLALEGNLAWAAPRP